MEHSSKVSRDGKLTMDFSIFSKREFPQGKAVTSGNSLEASYVESFFSGRSQVEITFDLLKSAYSHDPSACLSFMLPDAFAFFLPAYMRIALENYEEADAIPDAVIFHLLCIAQGGAYDEKINEEYKNRLNAILSSYSVEQLKAVAEFLDEMSKKYWHKYPTDDAQKALSVYWERFLK